MKEAEGTENTKETVSSRLNRTEAHRKSQRLWQGSLGLHRSNHNGVPVLRRRNEYELLTLAKKPP